MARRAVILILDGLRRDFVKTSTTRRLSEARADFAWFANHRSVFPSTTRVSAACIATGCEPGRHGLFGNSVVLRKNERLAHFDVGKPGFLDELRCLTGKTLHMPTLAERLASDGGSVVFSNVSPGAAYIQDPDGHGYVYHRAGSYGPGRVPVGDDGALVVTPDPTGDWAMTERFCQEVLQDRRPALAVLWLGEPDHTQHAVPLGSPLHLAALETADRCADHVIETCTRLADDNGDDVLLVIGSDHGHQTVRREIDIAAELAAAGFAEEIANADLAIASNGTAALIYVDHPAAPRKVEIAAFLKEQDWVDCVHEAADLPAIGLSASGCLAIAISMRQYSDVNEHGVAGLSDVAVTPEDAGSRSGRGQHGGHGDHEQAPFLMIRGTGFEPGEERDQPTSLIDIAPTVLRHLRVAHNDMDGFPLQSDLSQTGE